MRKQRCGLASPLPATPTARPDTWGSQRLREKAQAPLGGGGFCPQQPDSQAGLPDWPADCSVPQSSSQELRRGTVTLLSSLGAAGPAELTATGPSPHGCRWEPTGPKAESWSCEDWQHPGPRALAALSLAISTRTPCAPVILA